VGALAQEWMAKNPDMRVRFHNWWSAPRTWAQVQATDPVASHASWMENFPWTRLSGLVLPTQAKQAVDSDRLRTLPPDQARALLGDGNFAGRYQRDDAEMQAIWDVAVAETRELLDHGW
jgi:creatinine amidohydrolase